MHILPLFVPELLHTESYGNINKTHVENLLEKNMARLADFPIQVGQAVRDILYKMLEP